jgi:hypothetical protein
MTDGLGFPTRISAGRLIIMGDGRTLRTTAGPGSPGPTWTGVQHGSHGEPVAIMLAGPLCLHAV